MALKTLEVTKPIFDLGAFDEITLGKHIQFDTVDTPEQALDRLSNDSERMVKVINAGLEAIARKEARADSDGWHTFTEDGKLNGVYDGTPANPKKVNIIVLGLAKSVFGYKKDMDKDPEKNKLAKRNAKEQALAFIKSNDTIKEGLKVNAAFDENDDDDAVSETE